MRIAYLLRLNRLRSDGVTKKILDQVRSWSALGHEVVVFCLCTEKQNNNDIIRYYHVASCSVFKFFPPAKLLNDIDAFGPDFIYTRFDFYKPYLSNLAKKYALVMEINSNDLTETRLRARYNFKHTLIYLYNYVSRDFLLRHVSVFVFVTYELANSKEFMRFHVPSLVSPNGINLSRYSEIIDYLGIKKPVGDVCNFVFIGSPNQAWHGVDKINLLARLLGNKYVFHVIGFNKSDFQDNVIPDNVIFYGFVDTASYQSILCKADIAISTLALHRKQMNEACPLKTREYLAFGLPVIAAYSDTMFNVKNPEWFLQIDNFEENIRVNLQKIIEFVTKNQGVIVPHSYSKKYIDISVLESIKLSRLSEIMLRK